MDQGGFPEQNSIIQLMTQNIYNPELQDFVEEAVIECFHYLSLDMRQDKCRFSQNLLTCLADKGKEVRPARLINITTQNTSHRCFTQML